jgi:hypothetical protein
MVPFQILFVITGYSVANSLLFEGSLWVATGLVILVAALPFVTRIGFKKL